MKTQYFLYNIFFVLFFGLTSCKSDESRGEQTSGVLAVEVINDDKSRVRLMDLSEPSIQSSIEIRVQKSQSETHTIHFKSQCTANYLEVDVHAEIAIQNLEVVPLKDILPMEIFTPHHLTDPSLVCSISADVTIGPQFLGHVGLKQLKVKNVDTFENLNLPISTKTDSNFHYRSDTVTQNLTSPIKESKITTLCQNNRVQNYVFESTVLMETVFQDSLFEKENFEKCRIIIESPDFTRKWISGNFFIQNENPDATLEISSNFKISSYFDWKNEFLFAINIKNPKNIPVYFAAQLPATSLEILPVFFQSGSDGSRGRHSTIPARWIVEGGAPSPFPSQPKEYQFFMVPPMGSARILLISDANVQCPRLLAAPVNKDNCTYRPRLIGALYRILNYPSIRINGFSSLQIQRWAVHPKKLVGPGMNGTHYTDWAPLHKKDFACPSSKEEPLGTKTLYELPSSLNAVSSCLVE